MKGLYAITDPKLTPYHMMEALVEAAIDGGARLIQLRDKELSDRELAPMARRLLSLCQQRGVLFVVNDRVELAAAIGAHGVHIGKGDADYQTARRLMGARIIGVSCYNRLDLAEHFQALGADYVAFGSVFPSPTKPDAARAELSLISEASRRLAIPVCAIGGITVDNAAEVAAAGADMAAVISGLWDAGDPESVRLRASQFAEALS